MFKFRDESVPVRLKLYDLVEAVTHLLSIEKICCFFQRKKRVFINRFIAGILGVALIIAVGCSKIGNDSGIYGSNDYNNEKGDNYQYDNEKYEDSEHDSDSELIPNQDDDSVNDIDSFTDKDFTDSDELSDDSDEIPYEINFDKYLLDNGCDISSDETFRNTITTCKDVCDSLGDNYPSTKAMQRCVAIDRVYPAVDGFAIELFNTTFGRSMKFEFYGFADACKNIDFPKVYVNGENFDYYNVSLFQTGVEGSRFCTFYGYTEKILNNKDYIMEVKSSKNGTPFSNDVSNTGASFSTTLWILYGDFFVTLALNDKFLKKLTNLSSDDLSNLLGEKERYDFNNVNIANLVDNLRDILVSEELLREFLLFDSIQGIFEKLDSYEVLVPSEVILEIYSH